MKLTFIGGGNMATALIGSLLKRGWLARDIHVVDIDAQTRERLARDFSVQTDADIPSGMEGVDGVVLAVKPQHVRQVASALAPVVRDVLVISIAAGIRVGDLSRWLGGHPRIVRAMPNTPALALAGMTGLYAPQSVSDRDRMISEEVLGAAGSILWVDTEDSIDAVTAVSGSGPGYVFYFIEMLQRAAAELGFEESAARHLVVETFKGAVKLAAESNESTGVLRSRVTSKGGTTERALAELENAGVGEAIVRAVHAAAQRSRELGEALGRDSPTNG